MLDSKLAFAGVNFGARERKVIEGKQQAQIRETQPTDEQKDTFVRFGCGSC